MRTYTVSQEDIGAWMQEKTPQFIGDLASVIGIRSVSEQGARPRPFGEGCAKVLEHVLELAAQRGLSCQNHDYYCGTALLHGEGEGELGVFSHLDVVPEGDGWSFPPYQATVHEGLLIGRGVSDNKGSAVAAIYALMYLRERGIRLRNSVRVFFGCNEESGMEDIEYYLAHHKAPDFSLVPDCAYPVCNAEKGITQWDMAADISGGVLVDFAAGDASNMVPNRAAALLKLDFDALREQLAAIDPALSVEREGDLVRVTARGIGAHAAHPEHSFNAAAKLAGSLVQTGLLDEKAQRALTFVAEKFVAFGGEPFGIDCEDEASGKLTHIGGLTSVRDGRLIQNMNIRYPVTADYDTIAAGIRATCAACGFEATECSVSPPCHVDANTPQVHLLLDICRDLLGYENPQPYAMGGGTYARHLPNAVGFGPALDGKPSPFGTERGREHQPDECMEIADLVRSVAVLATALVELDRIS